MAMIFKNAKAVLGTERSTVYTCPEGVTAIVISAQAANVVGGTADLKVTAGWTDATDAVFTELAPAVPIVAGAAMGLISGSVVLLPGDTFEALCTVASGAKVTLGVIERS